MLERSRASRRMFRFAVIVVLLSSLLYAVAVDNKKAVYFDLNSVRLSEGSSYYDAQALNLKYLLMLDPDRLLYSFRVNAGINTTAQPYGGWEAPNVEVRGHFVGHYMSATAMMWASTGNAQIKKNMEYVVTELGKCQDKIGTGYLAAFPTSWFDRLENLKPVWAPYYTIHKIMAGLFDQYRITGNQSPFDMVVKIANYFKSRIDKVIANNTISWWYNILNNEFGGMNEIMYNIYNVTKDPNHLAMAHLFDKPVLMGPLASGQDELTGLHANTHIPEVIGAARRHEVTGDPTYRQITEFFFNLLTSTRTYATGGSNDNEHWGSPHRLGDTLNGGTEETCTQYNILKVARHIWQWNASPHLADFYERAILNGIIGIQRPNSAGVSLYMNPLGPGLSKPSAAHGWGTPFDSFWCCYGTGIESWSKLGDSIYFHDFDGTNIWINQFVPSTVTWDQGNLTLKQESNFPLATNNSLVPGKDSVSVRVAVETSSAVTTSSIWIRIPFWAQVQSVKATLNGNPVTTSNIEIGSYLEVNSKWKSGDVIALSMDPTLRYEHIEDDRPEYANLVAILYGPLLLCGITIKEYDLIGNKSDLSSWVHPVDYDMQLNSISLYNADSSAPKQFIRHSGFAGWISLINVTQGTDAPDSTFIITKIQSSKNETLVQMTSVNYPDYYVTYTNSQILVQSSNDSADFNATSTFRQVPGLVNASNSFSLEPLNMPGYYVSISTALLRGYTPLHVAKFQDGDDFAKASTFAMETPNFEYKPYSFVAKGKNRAYLLQPINEMVDEQYTAYFNVTTAT